MATGEKISQLTELAKVADGDWLTLVDISESNQVDQNKKISKKNLFADILSEGTGNFDPWDAGTTYETANKPIYVSHNGNVWKFVSTSDDTGTEPGTDDSVWDLTSTGELSHQQNTDTLLAKDTSDEVSAADLRAHLDSIVTTIDGTSTDNEIPTAEAVNEIVTGWGLEDARGAGDTMLGDVLLDASLFISAVNGTLVYNTDNADQFLISIVENSLGNLAGNRGTLKWDYSESAFLIANNAKLKFDLGVSVNEIVTTIDGTSTDDQLATAAATWTAIQNNGGASTLDDLNDVSITSPADNEFLRYNGTNWVNEAVSTGPFRIDQTLNAGDDANQNDIRDLANLLVNLETLPADHHIHFADGGNDGIVRVFDGRLDSTNWAMEIITNTAASGYHALLIEDKNTDHIFAAFGDGNIEMANLPTSNPGPGRLWYDTSDGNTVKMGS